MGFFYFLPRNMAFHFRMVDIAALAPEVEQGNVVFWARAFRFGAIWHAKTDVLVFFKMGDVGFSGIEEVMPDSSASVLFEKRRIAEIEKGFDVEPALDKGLMDSGLFNRQRTPERGPDERGIIEDQHADCFFVRGDFAEILGFPIEVGVFEIGEVFENLHAQFGDRMQVGFKAGACK